MQLSLFKMIFTLNVALLVMLFTAIHATSASSGGLVEIEDEIDLGQSPIKAGHTYVLLAHNRKFLSRIRRGLVDYIEAEKSMIDVFCYFRASALYNNKVSFKGDNGGWNFLSRINRFGRDNIEAAKPHIDQYSEFEVEYDKNKGGVYLKADNSKYLGVVLRGGYQNNIEAYYDGRYKETRFVLLEVK